MDRVFVIGPRFFNYSTGLSKAFQQLGCEVGLAEYVEPRRKYWQNKLSKFGWGDKSDVFVSKQYEQQGLRIIARVAEFRPKLLVILNGDIFNREIIAELRKYCQYFLLYTLDGIFRQDNGRKFIDLIKVADSVWCLDPQDAQFIAHNFDKKIYQYQFGYDEDFFNPQVAAADKEYDICFVGSPTANRLAILQQLAIAAKQYDWRLAIYGHNYWSAKHFWKKQYFRKKYYPLLDFVSNKNLSPLECARLYGRSKLCLNIHIDEHCIINNRCFEIMACNSCMLCDYQPHLREMLEANVDYIEYKTTQELVDKARNLLQDDLRREQVACSGQFKTKNISIGSLAKRMVECYE